MSTCEAFRNAPSADGWGFHPQRCEATNGLRFYFDRHGDAHAFCPAVGHLESLLRIHAADPEREDHEAHERHVANDEDHEDCPHCVRLAERQWQSWYAL